MREAEDSWNVFVNADASLYEACCVLQEKKVHRLPVFSRKSNLVVDVMTHARILHFVHSKLQRRGGTTNRSSSNSAALNELFDATPEELGIGTFCNISTLSYTSTIAEALRLFSENKLSCLPITDETSKNRNSNNSVENIRVHHYGTEALYAAKAATLSCAKVFL